MPASASTAISVVPPPMSTISEPRASVTGRSTPMPAAIGSSIRYTRRAPARSAECTTARRSTSVMPVGTEITTCGFTQLRPSWTLLMK